MASFQKFTDQAAYLQIAHVERTLENYSNSDINKDLIQNDTFISPKREMTGYQYYKQIYNQCYVYGRSDVKTLVGIIVTLPHDTPANMETRFWETTYDFLNGRYAGEENVISCVIHRDETGQPHMHYLFCPVVPDLNEKHTQVRKICCSDLLPLKDYTTFHDDFQRYLRKVGCPGTVKSGVTRYQERNMSVAELKRETPEERKSREALIEKNRATEEHERAIHDRWNSDRDQGSSRWR